MYLFSYKNYLIPSYLFFLIPLGLVTGPFLPDLFLSIIAFIFVLESSKKNKFEYLKSKFSIIFFLFYFFLIISSLLSNHVLFSLENSLLYIRYFFFAIGVYYLCINKPDIINTFFRFLFFTVLIVVIDGYIEFIFEKNILGRGSPDPSRILSFFHAMIIGSYLSKVLPLMFIFLILQKSSTNLYKLTYLFIGLTYILIFLSGERSAFIHASIVFVLLSLVIKDTRKLFIILSTFISILLITLINTNEVIKKRMFLSVWDGLNIQNLNQSFTYENIIFFSPVHDRFIRAAIEIFKDNKIIGSGPNTFRYECKDYSKTIDYWNGKETLKISCNTHPHNTYAQLLSETGIIGFSIIVCLFLFLSFSLLKYIIYVKYEDRYFNICLLMYFLIALFPLAPTGNFFNNWVSAIYFLPLGLFLSKFNPYGEKIRISNNFR